MELTMQNCRELIGELSRLEVGVMEGEEDCVYVDGLPVYFFLRFNNCLTMVRPVATVEDTPEESGKVAILFRTALEETAKHFVADGYSFATPPGDNAVFVQKTVHFHDGTEFVAEFESFVAAAGEYEKVFSEALGAEDGRGTSAAPEAGAAGSPLGGGDAGGERPLSDLELMAMRI